MADRILLRVNGREVEELCIVHTVDFSQESAAGFHSH